MKVREYQETILWMPSAVFLRIPTEAARMGVDPEGDHHPMVWHSVLARVQRRRAVESKFGPARRNARFSR